MNNLGTLHEINGRHEVRFERFFPCGSDEVFAILTNPSDLVKWHPFATGEMDVKVGGKILFDDPEGAAYEAVITELDPPRTFAFQEVDDAIHISLENLNRGCRMIFTHRFADKEWAVNSATGWHGCLDVLAQIVNDEPITWDNDVDKLRDVYSEVFHPL